MKDLEPIGHLLALLVHDLRNPAATLTANVDFLREVIPPDQDAIEALDDMKTALVDLRHGLTRMSWVADGFAGRIDAGVRDGDAAAAIQHAFEWATKEGADFSARGGLSIAAVLRVLVENAERHDRDQTPPIHVTDHGEGVRIEVRTTARAVDPSVRDRLFTVEGQDQIKGSAGGRYARFIGLLAARYYVESLGGSVRAIDDDGKHAIVIDLPRP